MWLERVIILLLSALCIYLIYKIHFWSKYINQVNKAYKEFYETDQYLSKIDLKEWINKWSHLQNIYNNKIAIIKS